MLIILRLNQIHVVHSGLKKIRIIKVYTLIFIFNEDEKLASVAKVQPQVPLKEDQLQNPQKLHRGTCVVCAD